MWGVGVWWFYIHCTIQFQFWLLIQLSQLIQWYTYHKATPNKDHPLYQPRFQMNRDSKKLLKCPPQEIQLVLLWAELTKTYHPLPTSVQPISITKTLLIVPTKNERDPPSFKILSAVYWWRGEDPFHFWRFSLLPFQSYWTWYDWK
jgi:hypothetical protein